MIATELGAVYLTRKQYDKVSTILQTVTTMGYGLMTNYADIFTTANENNKECIFEIDYKAGTDGQSSAFIYRFIPATTVTTNILGVNFNNNKNNYGGWNLPTQDLVDTYEPGDKRLDASVAVTEGHFDPTVRDGLAALQCMNDNELPTVVLNPMIRNGLNGFAVLNYIEHSHGRDA